MSEKLTVGGDDDVWKMFGRKGQSGNQLFFRSRTQISEVSAFAEANEMARVRCVLAEDEVGEGGMPRSTKDLDAYEDRLLGKLREADAEVYLVAVVTGEGNRDFYFAMRDVDQLRAGITAAKTEISSFSLQIAPVGDDAKSIILKALTLTPDMEQNAFAEGRAHGVPVQRSEGGGGLLGKLFGR